MNLRMQHVFVFLAMMLMLGSCSKEQVFVKHRSAYQLGDELEWAEKNWDDSGWQGRMKWVADGNVYWSRTPIEITKAPKELTPYGIQLEVYGEYEVFWDGVLIGKNGNPGREKELGPEGKMWTTHSIPGDLAGVGLHMLAIRSSLYYYPNHTGIYELEIDEYDDLLTRQLIETSYMHIFAGAFLITAIYFMFLFLGNKKEYPTLIFSISCFLFFILILTEFVKANLSIHYSLHVVRFEVISILMFGISFLIPLYLSMQFPYPRRKLFLAIHFGILLALYLVNHHNFIFNAMNMAMAMWLISFGIVVYATYHKLKGARLVLLALVLSLLLGLSASFDKSFFAGFGLILLSMVYLLSIRIKEQRLAYEHSLVQSTRLRLALLKKNIQPHFLMNTLTSLIDWVEESPKKGVMFIEALAKEFDLLNQIEDQTLIPIDQEIELCRSHLEIMKYRMEIEYLWEEEGIDHNQRIPPGTLHTLLENGITHSRPSTDNTVRFKLVYESGKQWNCYTFLTFASNVSKPSNEEGTGLKYIKARLTESYQSGWDLISEPTPEGWSTIIKIRPQAL